MIGLDVDIEIEDGSWAVLDDKDNEPKHGYIEKVGVLPRGMTSGAPSFACRILLDDGTTIIAEQSWRNIGLAMVALIARWGTP